MNREKTAIFDFDGTLVDSLSSALPIVNAIAPEFGFKTVDKEDVERCRNMPTLDIFRYLGIPLTKIPRITKRLHREIKKELPSIILFDGIAECLERLRELGVKLGVVTSNARDNVLACLERNQVLTHFDFVHSSRNIFGKHKTLARLLAKRGMASRDVYYIGDENRDIEAGRRCNVNVIAVSWGFHSKLQLQSKQPDIIADSPLDIVKFVLHSLFSQNPRCSWFPAS